MVHGNYIFNRQKISTPPPPPKTKTTEIVPLCETANIYLNTQAGEFGRNATCKDVCPCVFCLLPSNENVSINFRKQIAIEMRTSWISETALNNIVFWRRKDLDSVPAFVDLTNRNHLLEKIKQERPPCDMVTSIKTEYV